MANHQVPRDLPPAVAALPVCPKRKLPIPYSASVTPEGIAEFTVLDPVRKVEIAEKRLCGICSLPLGYWFVFLGDEHSLDPGGYFIDPPMHEDCAEASAFQLCPFIGIEAVPRRPPNPGDLVLGEADVVQAMPKADWVMAVTRSYRTGWEPTKDGLVLVFRAAPPKRVRRFTYVDGWLTDTGEGRRP